MLLTVQQTYELLAKHGVFAREICDKCGQVLGAVRFTRRGGANVDGATSHTSTESSSRLRLLKRKGTVLNQEAKPIEHGYFMNSGLASILTILAKGKSVEVGLAGADGFVGLPLVVGFKSSPTRAIVQIHGSAFRIRVKDLVRLLAQCPARERCVQRHPQQMSLQSTRV